MDEPAASFHACAAHRTASADGGAAPVCPIRAVMHGIGGKWVAFVLKALDERPCRFGELRRLLSDVTQRMLTQTLRDLERDGLVSRTVHPTKPPSVEYALTPLGQSLCVELRSLFRWAQQHGHAVLAARDAFDRAG